MKYMLLIHMAENAMTESERASCYEESTRLVHDLNAEGKYISANPLQPVATATSVKDGDLRSERPAWIRSRIIVVFRGGDFRWVRGEPASPGRPGGEPGGQTQAPCHRRRAAKWMHRKRLHLGRG